MNAITFTKMGKGGAIPEFKGYRMTHPKHPGREFAIGHTSSTDRRTGEWQYSNAWTCCDVVSGVAIGTKPCKTRVVATGEAYILLDDVSPEALDELIAKNLAICCTAILRRATEAS